jgi:serine/tyrosine/threonine adenylyltransferase
MTPTPSINLLPTEFEQAFAAHEGQMFTRVTPQPLEKPALIASSPSSARLLGVDPAQVCAPQHADFWSGNWADINNLADDQAALRPAIAQVYSGHQFGVWAGQLGDGRAMSIGRVLDRDGQAQELQFKGAGITPYSRGADGRAVLRSSIREFLASEAMVGLGIPTTRVLTLTKGLTPVFRENVEQAAVVTRVAPSFLRFGSFEHYHYNDQPERLKALADFVLDHFYPVCRQAPNPYAALLEQIVARSARLVAQWQAVGFCHGVLNTDNMSVLGLTIDYGPYGFLDSFNPAHICNHSDHAGRYSYQNQPSIVQWNCYALGQTFVALIGSVDETKAILGTFKSEFETAMKLCWRSKLGLHQTHAQDDSLIDAMFELMQRNQVDWTIWFRSLSTVDDSHQTAPCPALRDLCFDRAEADHWVQRFATRIALESGPSSIRQTNMNRVNPKFVLRNYLAQRAIDQANEDDFSELVRLQQLLADPYAEQPQLNDYAKLPPDWASKIEVSCSS